jgi:tetratricopeptide (TPR) repeat protein
VKRVNKALASLLKPGTAALLAGMVVFVVFAPSLKFSFLEYDDGVYVFDNEAVVNGFGFSALAYAISTVDGGSWMPLTWLTHQLDTTLFGIGPSGRHVTNVLLHAATAAVLFLALFRFSGTKIPSLIVTGLFAFHPMRNESVAWIAERKDVLSGLMFALGLLAYHRYLAKRSIANYGMLCGIFALGLMAKPMLVTFPFVLLLLDFWPARRFGSSVAEMRRCGWPLVKEKLPLFGLALLACGATWWSQKNAGTMSRWSSGFWNRVADVLANYTFYLKKVFWPADLTVVYPEHHLATADAILAGIGLLIVSAYVIWRGWDRPWLAVGWFWFVSMLVPVIGLVPVGMVMVADRYTYLPSIGLALAVVWQVAWLVRDRLAARRVATVAGMLCVTALAWLTVCDLARWENTETLFEAANRVAPSKIAYNNLARHYIRQRDYPKAIEAGSKAIELDPGFGPSYSTRSMAYACLDDYAQAKQNYDEAIRRGDRPLRNTGGLAGGDRDPEANWELFAASIGLEPRTAESFVLRGRSRVKLGRLDQAISDFTAAIGLKGDQAVAYYERSGAFSRKGAAAAAIADATRALELNPDFADAYAARAIGYIQLRQLDLALQDNNRCIELSPTNALYFQNRAVTYFQLHDIELARRDVETCRSLGGRPHQSFLEALAAAGDQNSPPSR